MVNRTTAPSQASSAPGEARREVGDAGARVASEGQPHRYRLGCKQACRPASIWSWKITRSRRSSRSKSRERYRSTSAAQVRRRDEIRVSRESEQKVNRLGQMIEWLEAVLSAPTAVAEAAGVGGDLPVTARRPRRRLGSREREGERDRVRSLSGFL